MFNFYLMEIAVRKKREELQELQTNQPTNTVEIEELKREVRYLEAVVIRYKIAKLLGLDTDADYIKDDFLGVEEENVDDFNLTPEARKEYDDLVKQLPPEQLRRFKIRRQLAKIVNKSEIENVEHINPNLTKYNLTQEQIKEFEDLVNKLNSIPADTTKFVRVDAARLLKEEFEKLNVEDISEYRRLKGVYLDSVDKLMRSVDKSSYDSMFSSVSNYELADDLSTKHPELTVKLSFNGVKNLLAFINTHDLSEEEYNKKLELLTSSISALAQDDATKVKLVNLVNSTNFRKYSLRSDLCSKINLEGAKLELQDAELDAALAFLDSNYDALDEKERDKCYSFIKNKIASLAHDVKKVEELNKSLLKVKNSSLAEKLRTDFSREDTIKFNNQHMTAAQMIIDDEMRKLQKKRSTLLSKKSKSPKLSAHYDVEISKIDKAIEHLSSIQKEQSKNKLVSGLDSRYNKKTDKLITLRKEIEDLKQLKEQVNSRFHKSIVDKKINRRNKKIAKLKKSQTRIVGAQKKILTPKMWLASKKGNVSRHFEAKTEIFQSYSEDYQNLADSQRNLNSMFSGIKAAFYEHKSHKYQNKAEFNQKISIMLVSSKIVLKGSVRQKINKNLLDKIRNIQHQHRQQNAQQTTI